MWLCVFIPSSKMSGESNTNLSRFQIKIKKNKKTDQTTLFTSSAASSR